MKRKYVVTGATSFLGVHLLKSLLKDECEIFAVIRPNSANRKRIPLDDRIKIIELDLNQIETLPIKLKNEKIDAFYHLAWEGTRAPYRDDIKLQKENYMAAVKAARSAIELESGLFVGCGSQAEYGKIIGAVDENKECEPLTAYGKEKYEAYLTIKGIAATANMRFVWPRIFSAYGPYDYSGTLVMSSLEKLKNNLPLDLTLCEQNWDYIFIEDVAEIFRLFFERKNAEGIYNIASGISMKLKYFIEEMKKIVGSDSQLNYGAVPYGKEGPVSFVPNIDKLKKDLSWNRMTSFENGIKKIIESESAYEKN